MRFDGPEGYHSVSAILMLASVETEIEFLVGVFEASVTDLVRMTDGTIRYAEIHIGDSIIMLDKAHSGYPPTRSMVHVWTDDVASLYERARKFGATSIQVPTDRAYGSREACIQDGQGNAWLLAERTRKLSRAEIERRLSEQRRRRL